MFPARIRKNVNRKINRKMNNRTGCVFHKTNCRESGLNLLRRRKNLGSVQLDLSPTKTQTRGRTRLRATPIPKNENIKKLRVTNRRTSTGKVT